MQVHHLSILEQLPDLSTVDYVGYDSTILLSFLAKAESELQSSSTKILKIQSDSIDGKVKKKIKNLVDELKAVDEISQMQAKIGQEKSNSESKVNTIGNQ